ncbi:hypothetical protein M378DRAFT_645267 [Amanita muscaria Koide BX008]|uniref:Uncharacterized protein n=1 Tax=Amanita muscaria (strain Koide BX008) TaxID=946122 RepID=A0A0C2RY26_AMAMK|nr:hypothetical protein M378DRAFT_645267 [Amanita muscaria Koide BX008]
MSDSSTAIFPKSTNVKVNKSDVNNSGRDNHIRTYNVQNSYNIVFPDVISAIQQFVAWIGSRGRDPVEISDIVPLQIPSLVRYLCTK